MDNRHLFAFKYMLYLPTEDALRQELERERTLAVKEATIKYSTTLQTSIPDVHELACELEHADAGEGDRSEHQDFERP